MSAPLNGPHHKKRGSSLNHLPSHFPIPAPLTVWLENKIKIRRETKACNPLGTNKIDSFAPGFCMTFNLTLMVNLLPKLLQLITPPADTTDTDQVTT
jgi:hypothetical protein